jgi:hypothetical protein
MQREEPNGIVILCDFCRRDWDGQEPMIEGHHGSVLCLQCLKQALIEQAVGEDKYKCTLCLRFNIPPALPRWSHAEHTDAVACQECLYQSARTFGRTPGVEWKFDPAAYPPAVKVKIEKPKDPGPEESA